VLTEGFDFLQSSGETAMYLLNLIIPKQAFKYLLLNTINVEYCKEIVQEHVNGNKSVITEYN
jgi:hypothetical protein